VRRINLQSAALFLLLPICDGRAAHRDSLACVQVNAPIALHACRRSTIKDGVRDCVHKYAMSENLTSTTNGAICPVCGPPIILLHTIKRAFAEDQNVFKCKPRSFQLPSL
jgi:Na+/H+ antiporter NhaD/arsenite permease-like protein